MRVTILLISFLAACASVYAQEADDKSYIKAELTAPGTLAEALGDRANTIDSLVVEGPINDADFYTMWSATFYGKLSAINLEKAKAEDNRVPARAFYRSEQFDPDDNMTLYMTNLRNIILGEGIEEIGESAFSYSGHLQEMTLPSTLRRLGRACFCDCPKLSISPLILPEGLEEIPNRCFMNCKSLSEVVLPSTIKSINNSAFLSTGVTKINFPEGLEMIGETAFYGADLGEVILPESCINLEGDEQFAFNRNLKKLLLPDGLSAVPSGIAFECEKLLEVNIPSKAETIGSEAFYRCPLGAALTLPEGLTAIEAKAFYGCSGLTEVTFPSTLKTLGAESCAGWSGLKKMYCRAAIPAKCTMDGNTGPFGDPDTSVNGGILPNIPVYIPVGSIDSYRKADGWNIFFNYIESEDLSAIETVTDGANATVTCNSGKIIINAKAGEGYSVYSLDGRVIASGTTDDAESGVTVNPGYYIVTVAGNTLKIKM